MEGECLLLFQKSRLRSMKEFFPKNTVELVGRFVCKRSSQHTSNLYIIKMRPIRPCVEGGFLLKMNKIFKKPYNIN